MQPGFDTTGPLSQPVLQDNIVWFFSRFACYLHQLRTLVTDVFEVAHMVCLIELTAEEVRRLVGVANKLGHEQTDCASFDRETEGQRSRLESLSFAGASLASWVRRTQG